jgi:hypothetical protein
MKPLLSELLPCSGMHSPIRANRYPLTTITGAQRASDQCSLAPRRRRPPRRPQHSLPCFMHSEAQRPWQLIRPSACSIRRRHASPAHAGRPRRHDRFLNWSPVVGALQRHWSCEEPTAMALLKLKHAILEFAAPIPPLCLEALRSRFQGAQATVDPCHLVG